MRMMISMFFFANILLTVFAGVHKFSPEFQSVYDAAISSEVREAQRKGAWAKLVYRIVDDEGIPVTNTAVRATWQNDYPRKTWKETFITDTNGMFIAKAKVGSRFGCIVEKPGYYASSGGVDFHWRKGVSPLVKDGKWQPYGEHRTIILKRIKNPANMNLIQHVRFGAPVTNVWVGFDLEKFSWTPPYGNGKHDDILIRFNYQARNKYYTDWSTMDISFTNNPCSGFYELKKDLYSEMKNPYSVDTNQIFIATNSYSSVGTKSYTLGESSCLVFRTRTKVDEDGRLVSAHYGMIYGRWAIGFGMKAAAIFFNPRPNDINIEDLDEFTRTRLKYKGEMK